MKNSQGITKKTPCQFKWRRGRVEGRDCIQLVKIIELPTGTIQI